MALTDAHVLKVIRAAVLLGRHGEILSEFEAGLVQEVAARFRAFGREAVISEAEWAVLETAIEAMAGQTRLAA